MRMFRSLMQTHDRRNASVGPVESGNPFGSSASTEGSCNLLLGRRPTCTIMLMGRIDIYIQSRQQLGVELRFDRADRHVASVRRLVHRIEGCSTVEQVGAPFVSPRTRVDHGVRASKEVSYSVDDCSIDDLASPGLLGLTQRCQNTRNEIHPTATEVTHDIEWDLGGTVGIAYRVQGARDRNVTHIVARGMREGSVLAPSGHPTVNELRVARPAFCWTDTETFGDTRPVPFDEKVRSLDHCQQGCHGLRSLEVKRYGPLTPIQHVLGRLARKHAEPAGPLDSDNFRSHICQRHTRERSRPHSADLQNLQTVQGPCLGYCGHIIPSLPLGVPAERSADAGTDSTSDPKVA
ncbi:hypothetical protein RHRU231_230055 [Rhodococcus ruber]|uniref:Uncharacterized protein n=1 Tax=Rhodococcus ruber TaxID=1830 RepID=A0A098BGA8_9NOCA|nr:hypothetical protein RHRU231_230055 [Rhodococcus ruber]